MGGVGGGVKGNLQGGRWDFYFATTFWRYVLFPLFLRSLAANWTLSVHGPEFEKYL